MVLTMVVGGCDDHSTGPTMMMPSLAGYIIAGLTPVLPPDVTAIATGKSPGASEGPLAVPAVMMIKRLGFAAGRTVPGSRRWLLLGYRSLSRATVCRETWRSSHDGNPLAVYQDEALATASHSDIGPTRGHECPPLYTWAKYGRSDVKNRSSLILRSRLTAVNRRGFRKSEAPRLTARALR